MNSMMDFIYENLDFWVKAKFEFTNSKNDTSSYELKWCSPYSTSNVDKQFVLCLVLFNLV